MAAVPVAAAVLVAAAAQGAFDIKRGVSTMHKLASCILTGLLALCIALPAQAAKP